MKPNAQRILEDAIEAGVNRGWHRAHKYVDNPTEESIKEEINRAIMNEVYEYFIFDSLVDRGCGGGCHNCDKEDCG